MEPISLDTLLASVGKEVGVSPWRTVTQRMIDQFADATDDHQFIHCDPERAARETPFGGTIAHGFLSLSLLSAMTFETMPPIENTKMGVNHGFDTLRFLAPVKTGSRIRTHFVLADVKVRPSGWVQTAHDVTIEIEGSKKPALTARWLTLTLIERQPETAMSGDANALDQAALAPYLEAHVPGFSKLCAAEKFKSGQSNPTYLLTAASGRYVLRAKPPGQLLKSAHQVDREFRVMQALSTTSVPVPRMLHLSGEMTPIGRMFYVMEFLDGRIFWDPSLPDTSGNDERAAIYDAMNATLAALHQVDVEAVGLGDFGKPGSYFQRQFARWTSQYRASETESIAAMDRLMTWLETHMPADDGRVSLVHGDYRLDNMIFAKDEPKVIAVLDWELSTLGHPFADLAYQCMQWRLPHGSGFRGLDGIDRASIGLPSEEAYVAAYCRRRGIDGIGNWTFFLAFSFFRLAAICQGVYRRALDGNASNPEKARTYGEAVKLLAALAVELIDKKS